MDPLIANQILSALETLVDEQYKNREQIEKLEKALVKIIDSHGTEIVREIVSTIDHNTRPLRGIAEDISIIASR
jgi:hypothetical protein